MEFSIGLEWIAASAKFVQGYNKDKSRKIEYYFLSFLTFAEKKGNAAPAMKQEVEHTSRMLGIKCTLKPGQIKQILQKRIVTDKDKLRPAEAYIEKAETLARDSGSQVIKTWHLLHVILDEPSELIREFLKSQEGAEASSETEVKEQKEALDENFNIADVLKKIAEKKEAQQAQQGNLGSLGKKVNEMTKALLKDVKGQDYAVKTAADGYFHAELLSDSGTARKRPRATFLFAGPPGVGKTFLAEKIADFLGLPHLLVDMSSCSDRQMGAEVFAGVKKSYTSASRGLVTGFAADHPKSVLIFDEVEKAHKNVLHLFYQMLDRGVLTDLYTEKEVSFKDTIIIMTTNAGHNLYEGKEEENLSLLPDRAIVNAIKKDVNPDTKEPFFPEALVTRMAAGSIVMFNHLKAHNLQKIIQSELDRQAKAFREQYNIEVEIDPKIASLIMYSQGGIADARSLGARARQFFKDQVLECIGLFDLNNLQSVSDIFSKLRFVVNDWNELEQLDEVFKVPKKQEILFFGNDQLGNSLRDNLMEYSFHVTSVEEEAFDIFAKKDIQIVLVDLITKQEIEFQKEHMGSMNVFDKVHFAASALTRARSFIQKEAELFPGIPMYLLDRGQINIDDQLEFNLIRMGIRGKVDVRDNYAETYRKAIETCLEHSRLQMIAQFLQSRHNMIKFEVSPYLHKKDKVIDVRCRNYKMCELIDTEDEEFLVSNADRPAVKFHDVVGAGAAKEELQFYIEYLKNPKKFLAKGLKPPKGLLFYGPPGTGKTMLAKAMAGETDITFMSESASNFVNQYSGSGPAYVREMFKRAKRYAPAILFIDEIDAIGRTRTGGSTSQSAESTLNTLLTEMDGFKVDLKRPVFIIAATNFKVSETIDGQGYIDKALVRRFDRKILIDLPTREERNSLLTMLCEKTENCKVSSGTINSIAGRSVGLSNAILSNVVSMAVRMAQNKGEAITDEILEEAFETTVHGEAKDWGYGLLERVAWHEAGHAYMYWKAGKVPAYLTIIARGQHGGYMQKDDADVTNPLYTREELLEKIRVALAGRASEIVRYGKDAGVSTGISGDLKQATDTARMMICNYGMDDEIGLVYISPETAKNSEIAMLIHKKTVEILKEQMDETIRIIGEDAKKIERLANVLLEKNSMTGEEIDVVLSADFP